MNAAMESDLTAHVLQEIAVRHGVLAIRLACRVPMDGELEYLDVSTLATAFEGRAPY